MPASNFYSPCITLAAGCTLYATFSGGVYSNPVLAGYYSDGTNCFYVTGNSGVIQTKTPCPSPTTTTTTTPTPGAIVLQDVCGPFPTSNYQTNPALNDCCNVNGTAN